MAKRKKKLHKLVLRSLEHDLLSNPEIAAMSRNHTWAQHLYATLCNNEFWHNDNYAESWSITWRGAGSIVSDLRNSVGQERQGFPEWKGRWAVEEYTEWYCTGDEGTQFPEIVAALEKLGWKVTRYEPQT